jgi:Protein kinase domain
MSTILDQVETDHKSQTEDIDDYVSTYSATNTSVTSKFQTLRSSPQYMAPEVIDDCCIDSKKAEIWSMGVILFGMTTGDLPFGAIDDMRSSHAAPLRHPSFYSFALPHKGEDLGPDSTIDILERIKTSQKKPYPDWISKELMVLLNGMLVGNPYKRYSLYDIKASDWMDALPEESEQPLRHDIIVPKRLKHPKTAERSYFSFVECFSVFSSCDPFPKTPIVTSEDCDQSLPDDGVLYKADSSSTIAGNDMLNGFSGMGRVKQRPLSYNNSKPFLVGRSYSGQQSPASPNYGYQNGQSSSNYNSPRGSIRVSPRNSPSDIQKDKEAIRRFSFSKVVETEALRRESLKNGSLSKESPSAKASPLFAQEPSPPRVPVQMKVLSPPKRPFPQKIPNQVREPSTKKVPVLPKEPALYRPTLSKEPSLTKLPPREPSTPPNVPKLTKEPSLTKIPKEPSPTKLTRENSSTKIPLTREGSSSRMTNITRENSSSRIALTRESSLSKIPPLTKIPSMKDSSTKEVILMAQMMMAQRLELESQNELNQEQD